LKLGRRKSMDLAVVSAAVLLSLSKSGKCERARIALGSVFPTPMRAKEAEKVLQGKRADETLIRKTSECAGGECRPITDLRGSAEYRMEMVKILVERAVKQALAERV
jgi:aerobic carbon-monoxide dehydrogenase medium subunit